MSIKIEFTFETVDEATKFLAKAYAESEPRPFERPPIQPEPLKTIQEPAVVEPTPTKKPRAKKEKPVEPTEAPLPSLDDVRAALGALLARKGIDACTAVLAGFQVNRIGELNPGEYDSFIAACAK